MDERGTPARLLEFAAGRYDRYLELLEGIVNVDSGSYDADGVNRVAELLTARLTAGGWAAERVVSARIEGLPRLGDAVIAKRTGALPPERGGARMLLLAHLDTVFDAGAASARPFRTAGGVATGPGVIDDKCGVATGVEAVELLLDDAGFDQFAEIVLLCTPDEEIGSPASRQLIEKLAAEADVVIGLEAARRNGDIVSARKGMATFEIVITGKAAHAGVAPELGLNACLEAAHKTIALHALNGRWDSVTCNVGTVRGGSRTNVVAAEARLGVELRAATTASFEAAVEQIEAITAKSWLPGTSATCTLGHAHLPMERTPATARLAALTAELAQQLGFTLGDQATGGCGDANVAAATGTPTIDGLGPRGGGVHTEDEFIELDSIVPRLALLASLLTRLGRAC
jgi:glutamate carboxypeptidase